jgi:hypothetical protein
MDKRWERRRSYKEHAHDGTGGRWSLCTVCGKRSYWSRRSAKTAARQGNGGHPYECEEPGTGRWHLTTVDARSRQWFRDRDERIRRIREEGQDDA